MCVSSQLLSLRDPGPLLELMTSHLSLTMCVGSSQRFRALLFENDCVTDVQGQTIETDYTAAEAAEAVDREFVYM